MKDKVMYLTAAIAACLVFSGMLVFAPGLMSAQIAPPLVPPPSPAGLHLKLGVVQLTPAQAAAVGAKPPSDTEIQAAIAMVKANLQRNEAVLNAFYKAIGKDTSPAHVGEVLKSFPSMHCPHNQIAQCYGFSRAPGVPNNISPPFEP